MTAHQAQVSKGGTMMGDGKRITRDQFLAAQDVTKKFMEQEASDRLDALNARRAQIDALIGDLGGDPKLREWAVSKLDREKARGIGVGAVKRGEAWPPEAKVSWTLQMLQISLADVCEAFGVEPAAITGARA